MANILSLLFSEVIQAKAQGSKSEQAPQEQLINFFIKVSSFACPLSALPQRSD